MHQGGVNEIKMTLHINLCLHFAGKFWDYQIFFFLGIYFIFLSYEMYKIPIV